MRENSAGLDLNRDAVKLQTVEANGLYRLLNDWDPVLLLDGHLMSRVTHGYANTYGTTTVPAAAPGPRDYTHDTLFPAVRDMVRRDFGLEVFTHALFTPNTWPPTGWSHDRAAWTVEAKFIVNDYGLRNRLAIITETPGQPTFERRIYAQYAYLMALLEYTNAHAKEMQAVVKAADDKTVADVQARAESGTAAELARRPVPVARQDRRARLPHERRRVSAPGTSFMSTRPGTASGPPEVVKGVDDLTKPVGTRERRRAARVSAARRACADVAAKLRAHNIRVQRARRSRCASKASSSSIKRMRKVRSGGYDMTALDGAFSPLETREFPAGTFYRRHGAADGQRRVLLPRAAGARRLRRAGACSTSGCGRSRPAASRRPIRSSRCGGRSSRAGKPESLGAATRDPRFPDWCHVFRALPLAACRKAIGRRPQLSSSRAFRLSGSSRLINVTFIGYT